MYIFLKAQNNKKRRNLIRTFLILTTLASLSGLIGFFSGFNPLKFSAACDTTRNCGMSGMLMTYAYSISIFCSLLLGWIIHFKKNEIISKRNLIIIFILNFVGLYFTYTRGAMLGFLVGVPLHSLDSTRKSSK